MTELPDEETRTIREEAQNLRAQLSNRDIPLNHSLAQAVALLARAAETMVAAVSPKERSWSDCGWRW